MLTSYRRLGASLGSNVKYALRQRSSPHTSGSKRSMGSFTDSPGVQNGVLYGIIGINVAIFAAWQAAINDRQLQYFMRENFMFTSTGVFRDGKYHTLVTSFFSHMDISHLAFNMLAFYSFGLSALPILGAGRFLFMYMGGGILSSFAQAAWPMFIPQHWPAYRLYNKYSPSIGASGAVNSVVAWSILMFPRSILHLYGVVPVPAALLGLGFLGMDAYNLYTGDTNIGNAAHLAGTAYGAVFFLFTRRLTSYRRF